MFKKPTYEELEQRIQELEQVEFKCKRAEEELQKSKRLYSDLVKESPDAIISLDKTGNIITFNQTAERMSGFSAEQVIRKHFAKIDALAKQSIPKALKEFALVIAGTERPPFELIIERKDKSYLFMEANPRLIKHKGEKAWIEVILRDVTKRKRAEEALSALYSISQTVNQTLDFESVLNTALDKVIEVLNVDAALIRLLEEESQELVLKLYKGYTVQEIKHVVIRRKIGEGSAWRSLIAGGPIINTKPLKSEDSFRSKAGFLFSAQFPLNSKQQLLGIMGIHQRTLREFSPDEIKLLSNIGHQIGVAIENASLYQQTQDTVKVLKETQQEREGLISDLQKALAEVKTLCGMLPICSHCKNVRDDKGYWDQIESYVMKYSDAKFSHSICPECAKKYYPEYKIYDD